VIGDPADRDVGVMTEKHFLLHFSLHGP
jgi:hypothetical protein